MSYTLSAKLKVKVRIRQCFNYFLHSLSMKKIWIKKSIIYILQEEDDEVVEQNVTNNANDTVQEGENKQLQQDKENELVSGK